MTIDDAIKSLSKIRDSVGGDKEVKIAKHDYVSGVPIYRFLDTEEEFIYLNFPTINPKTFDITYIECAALTLSDA